MKILLHAGRHKTGTSSLQKTLLNNKEVLTQDGWLYPTSGVRGYGHHELAERLSRRNINTDGVLAEAVNIFNDIMIEVNDSGAKKILLSSEAFQNCDPKVVKDFFGEHDLSVVFYVRNKVDYLVSSYLQKVHAKSYGKSILDYANNDFDIDYIKYFSKWKKVFGSSLNLRVFDRNKLLNGDVCYDFFQEFIPEVKNWKRFEGDANPSLPIEALVYKKNLNIEHPDISGDKCVYSSMANAVNEISGFHKFKVGFELFCSVIKNIKKEDRYIEELTGVRHPFIYKFTTDVGFNISAIGAIKFHLKSCRKEINFDKVETLSRRDGNNYLVEFDNGNLSGEWHAYFPVSYSNQNGLNDVCIEDGAHEVIKFHDSTNDLPLVISEIVIKVANHIATINDGKVILPYGVVVNKNEIVEESMWMSKINKSDLVMTNAKVAWNFIFEKTLVDTKKHFSGTVLVCYSNISSNYYHWHFEVLAKLWEYSKSNGLDNVDYIYAGFFPDNTFKYSSLISIGVPPEKIINHINESFTADRIIYPLLSSYVNKPLRQRMSPSGGVHHKGWSKTFCVEFPERVKRNLNIVTSSHKKRIFVNRITRGTRNIINKEQVINMLLKYGFEEFDPGTVPYEMQVTKFADAEIIVGIHGAGLTNCIYCNDGASVVEFIPIGHDDVGYKFLSKIKSLNYHQLYCEQPVRKHCKPANDDIYVNVDSLEHILRGFTE